MTPSIRPNQNLCCTNRRTLTFVESSIEKGFDAFCINRRDLPKEYAGQLLSVQNIEGVFEVPGTSHQGIDCFVFKRDIIPHMNLGNVFVGYPPIGLLLMTQMKNLSQNFTWFKNEKVTFHLGSDLAWKSAGETYKNNNLSKYWLENINQAKMVGLHFPAMDKLTFHSEEKGLGALFERVRHWWTRSTSRN
jgi:hypothetical protein